ncbi:hypothetical protein DB88DRAFT_484724 [Papiliotrema laurentii]|uniref:Uncharacterized protein n=1 Tax=Papiliotrema laurentii TaxID=5418 RepID=A0AAD9FT12_PAPLA|nr:hypothetical protein DB88DRAFT_484724 [Papiliotrema laurentii]
MLHFAHRSMFAPKSDSSLECLWRWDRWVIAVARVGRRRVGGHVVERASQGCASRVRLGWVCIEGGRISLCFLLLPLSHQLLGRVTMEEPTGVPELLVCCQCRWRMRLRGCALVGTHLRVAFGEFSCCLCLVWIDQRVCSTPDHWDQRLLPPLSEMKPHSGVVGAPGSAWSNIKAESPSERMRASRVQVQSTFLVSDAGRVKKGRRGESKSTGIYTQERSSDVVRAHDR